MFTISNNSGRSIGLPDNALSELLATLVSKARLLNLIWLVMAVFTLFAAPSVEAANKKPKAVIEKILPVNEGDSVTLDGSKSSDAEGAIASFHWEKIKGPDITIANVDSENTTFTAPAITKTNKPTKPVKLTIKLTVKDADNAESSKTVVVTVKPVNADPVANAGADKTVALNTSTTLTGSGSTDDGQIVSYAWKQLGATKATKVKLINANKEEASFTTPQTAGSLQFQLTVTDNDKKKSTATVNVEVSDEAPQGLNASFDVDKTSVSKGGSVAASVEAIAGGVGLYKVKFAWGDDSAADESTLAGGIVTKSASHTYSAEGTHTLVITVTDANNLTKTQNFTITVQSSSADFSGVLSLAKSEVNFNTAVEPKIDITGGKSPYTVKFSWGDGKPDSSSVLDQGVATKTGSHFYELAGTYSITSTITDADGKFLTYNTSVTVKPKSSVVDLALPCNL